MQMRVAVNSFLKCIKLFPSSLKTIISNRNSNVHKDQLTSMLEHIITIFLPLQSISLSSRSLIQDSLQSLSLLFKCRDKSKLQFREWLERILMNLSLFMQCLEPLSIDSQILEFQIPMDAAFEFIFNTNSSKKD